jgi:hypothetical protein
MSLLNTATLNISVLERDFPPFNQFTSLECSGALINEDDMRLSFPDVLRTRSGRPDMPV